MRAKRSDSYCSYRQGHFCLLISSPVTQAVNKVPISKQLLSKKKRYRHQAIYTNTSPSCNLLLCPLPFAQTYLRNFIKISAIVLEEIEELLTSSVNVFELLAS